MGFDGDSPVRSLIFSILRVAGFAYVGLIVLMAGCQRRLIYYPRTAPEGDLLNAASRMGFEAWRDESGVFHGWRSLSPVSEESARVLVFHGNAGHALDRAFYQDALLQASGDEWRVHLFEFPGYGFRGGKPSETAFFEAAAAALLDLTAEGIPLYLLGESLGGGVASEMASRFPEKISGLILITPFTSLADVAAHHYPFLPVRMLLRDRFDNASALQIFQGPVAVLLAERDEVVPAKLGRNLYESYHGPRRLWEQKRSRHNTLDLSPGHPWWREVVDFLREEP